MLSTRVCRCVSLCMQLQESAPWPPLSFSTWSFETRLNLEVDWWPSTPIDFPVSMSSCIQCQCLCVPPCPVYYMNSGDLNSNPYACPASILTTEPSPQLPCTFSSFNKNLIIMSYSRNYIISILGKCYITGISIGINNQDIFVIFNLYALYSP